MEHVFMREVSKRLSTHDYLRLIGVPELPPLTSPFDPGYDPVTLESHLDQSAHLMASLKISMACWMIADEAATRRKIAAAARHHVPTVTGGGPFEVAVAQGQLEAYLDLGAVRASRALWPECPSLQRAPGGATACRDFSTRPPFGRIRHAQSAACSPSV